MRRALALMIVLSSGCASQHGPAPVVDRTGAARAPAPAAAKPGAATPAVPEGHYLVKKGDTLYSIALENGADYREVAQWNSLDDPTRIRVGQLLRVTPPAPAPGTAVVGKIPSRSVESRPLGEAAAKPAPAPPVQAAKEAAGASEFIWPAKGKVITNFAEPRSKGIDIDGRPGDPILASAAGRVTYTGSGIPGLGKLVVIRHDNGFITVYAHNRDIMVKEQQQVRRGQKIA